MAALVCIACGTVQAETLTLDQALQIAYEQSPTMRQAGLNLEENFRNLQAQQAALKSQFSLTLTPLSYSKARQFDNLTAVYFNSKQTSSSARFSIVQPLKWTDGTLSVNNEMKWQEASSESAFSGSDQTTYSNSLNINFNQPLFTYNRTQQTLKELELSLENAQLSYAIEKLRIENSVTQQFLQLYLDQRNVQIGEVELANSRESYEIIKSKVEAGISAPEELYQADLTQTTSRGSLENKQLTCEDALDNFKILLGMPLDDNLDVVADVQRLVVDVNLAEAINYGLLYRMELRQKDISIQYALNDLVRTGAESEFKGSVDVSYGLIGTNSSFGNMYDDPDNNQSVSINFSVPLFDWGEKKHRLAASEAQLETRRISASEQEKQIIYEVRQAYRNLLNQETQIEIAQKNVQNARLTYEINLERYKNGDLTSKDISFYQNQLSSEQLNEVSALINYQVALMDLKIRTLWDFEKNLPVINQNQE